MEAFEPTYYKEMKLSDDKRNDFIAENRNNVLRIASRCCGRFLSWDRDDELSIALIALNQAIDSYEPETKVPFWAFANGVIKRRLIDYYRKEKRHNYVSLEPDENECSPIVNDQSLIEYAIENDRNEKIEEIKQYSKLLAQYEVTFSELEHNSPKHKDSRDSLISAALTLAKDKSLMEKLLQKNQIPKKNLSITTKLSPKTIERNRKYIIAVALLYYHKNTFPHLFEFIAIPKKEM